jgi:competence protein ComEC
MWRLLSVFSQSQWLIACGEAVRRGWRIGRLLIRRDPLPSRPLVAVAVAVGIGAAASRWLSLLAGAETTGLAWAAAVAACGGWAWSWARGRPRAAEILLLLAAGLGAAAWGSARFDLFATHDIAWQLGGGPVPVAVRGTVVESPRLLPRVEGSGAAAAGPASAFTVRVDEVRTGSRWRPAAGRATVAVGGEPLPLWSGTRVRILGRGVRPSEAWNPGEFDFAARARSNRRLSVLRVDSWDCVRVQERPPWWSVAAAVDRVRTWALASLARQIAPARLPLASALLVGARDSLPRAAADDFVATGTIHVLAISGLHVGLVAAGLFALLRGLCVSSRWASLLVAVATGLYMLLVGAETPVVRATLLIWVACAAVGLTRRPATINSLAVAAIAVLIWRPAEIFSAGAQLSFLSTAVLVGVARSLPQARSSDPIERLIERSRSRGEKLLRRAAWWFAALAISGGAVWLASAPLVASRFHMVSPVALVVNVVIAPLIPVAMACGFLSLIVAPVSSLVAGLPGAGCEAALAVVELAVAAAARVPGGHAWVAGPAGWWVVGWYGVLAGAVLWLRRDLLGRPLTWLTLAAAWSAVGLAGQVCVWPAPGLRVIVASLGHGCGIVVTSPSGKCLVYDAGRLGSPAGARRAMAAVLWSEGITRIDTLVVSHADADHFNAVPDLLTRFAVGRILVPEALPLNSSRAVATLLDAAAAAGVPVEAARAGDSFAIDPLCRARIHHPPAAEDPAAEHVADDNQSSLVVSIEAAGRRLLLTGDLEGTALQRFLAGPLEACDVLVAPHHGSHTSLPADIAARTRPRYVLASGRGGRRWPEVRRAYGAAAGAEAEVFLTGRAGAIAVWLTAGSVEVQRYAAGRWQPLSPARAALPQRRSQEPPPDPETPWQPEDDQSLAGPGGLVKIAPTTSRNNWLATYPPSRSSTPLVKP